MANTVQLTQDGNIVYPITDVSCVMGLDEGAITEAVLCWDGASTPVVANIPAGVVVTYNNTTYTGTLAASADTVGKIYMVATGTSNNYNRYMTFAGSPSYVWQNIGDTTIELSGYATEAEVTELEAKIGNVFTHSDFGVGNADNCFPEANIATDNPKCNGFSRGRDMSMAVPANSIIEITANEQNAALVIFLTVQTVEYAYAPASKGTFANNTTTGFIIPTATKQKFTITDACYVHISEGANLAFWPSSIIVRDATSQIQAIIDKTDALAIGVQNNATAISETNTRIDGLESTLPKTLTITSLADALHYADTPFGDLSQDGTYRYMTGTYNRNTSKQGAIARFKADTPKYVAFAKFLVEGTEGMTFDFVLYHNGDQTPMLTAEGLPVNKTHYIYFPPFTDTGVSNSTWYIRFKKFGPTSESNTYTIKLYGVYLMRESDYPGLPDVGVGLDYTKTTTELVAFSVNAGNAKSADVAKDAVHSSGADLAEVANKHNTAISGHRIGVIGDSLVTYSTQALVDIIGGYLNATVTNVGQGGGRINNNNPSTKLGFCSIESMALMPKDMKVLILWGGANDGYLFVNDDVVDPARLGSITDKPLGVADMFNYRVTDANVGIIDTPGRTQTFYQAYQTFIRNAQILFPKALLICVSQYRAYQYHWPHYDQVALKSHWPQLIQAEKECSDKWGTAICDLYTKSGIADGNCFTWLIDDGGSLIHPWDYTSERCANLILQTILENYNVVEPEHQVVLRDKDKDVAELKEYLVDLRSESEINVMTFEEAVPAFIQYCTDNNITLKNNMYLVFYDTNYAHSVGYFLIDYTDPESSSSWEEWTRDIVFDMRSEIDPATEAPYGVQTLAEAIVNFNEKATLELWTLSNYYYMYFYIAVGSWVKYRLTTPNSPSATSSWTKVDEGTDN